MPRQHPTNYTEAIAAVDPFVKMKAQALSSNSGVPFDDLLQQGRINVLQAFDRFDPERGVGFLTYAGHWIFKGLVEACCAHSLVRIPNNARTRKNVKWPTVLSLELTAVRVCKSGSVKDLGTIGANLADERESPERTSDRAMLSRSVKRAMGKRLTDQQVAVLKRRVWDGVTLSVVGKEMGLSRERVRQIQAAAISELSREMR